MKAVHNEIKVLFGSQKQLASHSKRRWKQQAVTLWPNNEAMEKKNKDMENRENWEKIKYSFCYIKGKSLAMADFNITI